MKTVSERRGPPTFDILVEIVDRNEVLVHQNTAAAVDALLNGEEPHGETRKIKPDGVVDIKPTEETEIEEEEERKISPVDSLEIESIRSSLGEQPVRIFPYAISKDLLDRVIRNLGIDARTVPQPEFANIIVALRSRESDLRLRRILEERDIPLHLLKKNAATHMRRMLQDLFPTIKGVNPDLVKDAIRETEYAIQRVMSENMEIALTPRIPPVRRMQHRMVTRYHLESESVGSEPRRHLVIFPHEQARH